jgi:hypothetical protein
MPLFQMPLSDHDIGVVQQWIDLGAHMNGADGGVMTDGGTDVVTPMDVIGSDATDIVVTDTGPSDTGPADTGPADSGTADTGPADTGPDDTGPADTGPADTGDPDASMDAAD